MWSRVFILLLLSSVLAARPQGRPASVQVVDPVKFSGEVKAKEVFEREFRTGLVFRLLPSQERMNPGWEIQVIPKDPAFQGEYSWVLTTPYRGFNTRYLFVSYGFSAREIVEMKDRYWCQMPQSLKHGP